MASHATYIKSTACPLDTMTLDQYREFKIQILNDDFKVNLTDEEKAHFNELTTETQMDNYAKDIIMGRWR